MPLQYMMCHGNVRLCSEALLGSRFSETDIKFAGDEASQ